MSELMDFSDVSQPSSPVKQVVTKVKKDGPLETVKVYVYLNHFVVSGITYVSVMSGLCFDIDVKDDNYSSSDLIDDFVSRFESVHKAYLPPQRDGGKDYRSIFLEGAGYFNTDNLKLLTYARCVSTNPEQGNMDITKLKVNNDVVNRRYPVYFIKVGNLLNSNESEHSRDLSDKMQDLINLLNAKQFKFSAKGDLGKKLINYEVLETKLDLTNWPTSKEYKQMRLLLACSHAIKQKEYKRGSLTSPLKSSQDGDDNHDDVVVPIAVFSRKAASAVQVATSLSTTDTSVDTTDNSVKLSETTSTKGSPATDASGGTTPAPKRVKKVA